MFGIVATIIAAVKGRSGFAWFTGIWTCLAIILTLSGTTKYAVAPGFLFLIIAISMKKAGADEDMPSAESVQAASKSLSDSEIASKKFICKKCGKYSSGWYQTCPNCGAVGKMEKARIVLPATETENTPNPMKNDSAPIQFCRECGMRLYSDALFCPECGTKNVPVVSHTEQPVLELKPALELKPTPDETKQKTMPVPLAPAKEAAPLTIDLREKGLSPASRRAFIFAEDGEWAKADDYFEKVLDDEPENPYAYLGKLLVELKVERIEQLRDHVDDVVVSRNYKRALRYADNDLRSFLESLTATPENETLGSLDTADSEVVTHDPEADSAQETPIGPEEARMRALFPNDYHWLILYWARLYYIKSKFGADEKDKAIATQLTNGYLQALKTKRGPILIDMIKQFSAAADEKKLADELSVVEHFDNDDGTFDMPWDDNLPTVYLDVNLLGDDE